MVECAERYKELYWSWMVLRTVLIIFVFVGFVMVGAANEKPWLGACGIIIVGMSVIVPHVLSIQQFLRGLPCPHCDQSADITFLRRSRLYLRCKHCGEESPTDCVIPYAGGPPETRLP